MRHFLNPSFPRRSPLAPPTHPPVLLSADNAGGVPARPARSAGGAGRPQPAPGTQCCGDCSRYQGKKWKILGVIHNRVIAHNTTTTSTRPVRAMIVMVRWWGWRSAMSRLAAVLVLVVVVAARASVYSGREDLCSLEECDCRLDTVTCTCTPSSSFQVTLGEYMTR